MKCKRIDEYRCTAYADGHFVVEHVVGDRMACDRKIVANQYIVPMTGSGDNRTLQQGAEDEARRWVKEEKQRRRQAEALNNAAITFTIKG